MRVRHATLAVAVLTVLGLAACGDDPEPVAPAPAVSTTPSADGALGGTDNPDAPGASARPSTPPTEGTSTVKPPKKGGEPAQGPAGKSTTTP